MVTATQLCVCAVVVGAVVSGALVVAVVSGALVGAAVVGALVVGAVVGLEAGFVSGSFVVSGAFVGAVVGFVVGLEAGFVSGAFVVSGVFVVLGVVVGFVLVPFSVDFSVVPVVSTSLLPSAEAESLSLPWTRMPYRHRLFLLRH